MSDEEVPAVEEDVVAVERVKLGTEAVTDEERVTESVREEQIDTDGVHDAQLRDTDRVDADRR